MSTAPQVLKMIDVSVLQNGLLNSYSAVNMRTKVDTVRCNK